MKLSDLGSKWVDFVGNLNTKGIPLPTIRDPKTGTGSVSLTMLVISMVLVIVGVIGKWSGKLGGIDINNSLQLFYASSALYFGRTWISKDRSAVPELESRVVPPKKVSVDNPDR